jgi:hypothetical protein
MPRLSKDLSAIRSKVASEILAKYLPQANIVGHKHLHHLKARCYHTSFSSSFLPKYEKIIATTINKAWKPSTYSKYSNGIQHFMHFCDNKQIPHNLHLPASEFLLSAFASSLAGRVAGKTAHEKLSAVRAWHIQNNMPWLGSKQLLYVLCGVEHMAPSASRAPACPPITAEMLSALFSDLDHSNNLDVAVYFSATAAFWGQIQLRELFSATERKFDSNLAPCISNLGVPNGNGSRTLQLPNTKMGGIRGEQVILCHQDSNLDPICALDAQLKLNAGSSNDPLCAYFNHLGTWIFLTC